MNNNRFFVFGCSYTNWGLYPTWADLIGINYQKYYNFGKPGACNTYIMHKFMEVNDVCKLNAQTDFVMIALTGFGRFTYLEYPNECGNKGTWDDEFHWFYNWHTNGDIMSGNPGHPEKVKIILKNKLFNFAWGAYNSWMALKIIKEILTLKEIPHKIIMALDNSHYIDEEYVLGLHHKFDNIGNIVPKIKEMYDILDVNTSIESYRRTNRGEGKLYPNDSGDLHPTKEIYYDFLLKYLPELITEKSKELLNISDENWKLMLEDRKSRLNNLLNPQLKII